MVRTRFAPSPTGYMHLGNVWVAFLNWLWTRQHNGQIVLRIEDIDFQRSKPMYIKGIQEDLSWLGLDYDEGPGHTYFYGEPWQSRRLSLYRQVLSNWEKEDLVYPCFCTRARIRSIASAPHEGDHFPVYDGHCRFLSADERQKLSQIKNPSLRFKMETGRSSFKDLISGLHSYELHAGADDFVVERADHMIAYQLAVSIDDAYMGITHVFRGNDLLSSTFYQAVLIQSLHKKVPMYVHLPLLVDKSGVRLSKRQQGITIRDLRQNGMKPDEIIGWLLYWAGGIKNPEPVSPEQALRNINFDDLKNLSQISIVADL